MFFVDAQRGSKMNMCLYLKSLRILFIFALTLNWAKLSSNPVFQVENTDSIRQAIQALEDDISTKPGNASLNLRLGYLYLKIEKSDKAMLAFKKCLKLDDMSAEAYNGMGLSYHGKGESVIIPIEVIKKLFKIDNYSKAEKQYKRALELKPDYIDPLYNLGVNFLAKGGEDNYQKSVESLQRVLEKDMVFKDADCMLGIAYQHSKDYVNAELVFKRVIEANRSVGRSMLRLSDIYLDTGREEDATNMYYEGIVHLYDPKTWNDIYAELEMLIEPDQRERFQNLPIDEKGHFIRKFWKQKDPVPTTKKNERLVEHFRRVNFVRNIYPDASPPFYDDRGKIYVKYGPPDNKYTAQMLGQEVKDNESWSYERSIRKGLTFDFVKRGTSYYLAQDLASAAPTGSGMEAQLGIMRELYIERADFTESYNRFAIEIGGGEGNVRDALANFQNVMSNFHSERYNAEKAAPIENYDYRPVGKQLPFVYNISQFRTVDGKSRVEVYLGVSNNKLEYFATGGGMATSLKCQTVIQDSDYVDIRDQTREFALRAQSAEEIRGTLFLHQENYDVQPGEHLLAIQLENPQGKSKGFYRNDFEARDFRGDSLMISDIQLATDIHPFSGTGKFVKKNLKIVPYPYTVIRRKRPIFIYLEIYNLKFNASGQTDYTVTHQVNMIDYERSFFSKTFGAIGRIFKKGKKMGISTSYQQVKTDSEISEYLSLDMGKLPVGTAELIVWVQDNTSGETTTQSINLQLIE